MKRVTPVVLIAAMTVGVMACPTVAFAIDDTDTAPMTVFVGLPDAADLAVLADPVKATCSTTAIPPQEVDPTDLTRVTARTELQCNEGDYPAVLTAQFKYFGNDPAGPVGSGTPVGTPTVVEGRSPLTAEYRISKFSIQPGWYKTVGNSQVTYPYRLDRQHAPQGCTFLSDYKISCKVASSAVQVESLRWVGSLIERPLGPSLQD